MTVSGGRSVNDAAVLEKICEGVCADRERHFPRRPSSAALQGRPAGVKARRFLARSPGDGHLPPWTGQGATWAGMMGHARRPASTATTSPGYVPRAVERRRSVPMAARGRHRGHLGCPGLQTGSTLVARAARLASQSWPCSRNPGCHSSSPSTADQALSGLPDLYHKPSRLQHASFALPCWHTDHKDRP